MGQFGSIGFPILTVKRHNRQDGRLTGIETIGVHTHPIGVGARSVERLHATFRTKGVIGDAGIEPIRGQLIGPCRQFKIISRHDQMDKSRPCADGTIAGFDFNRIAGEHAKAHIATMARACSSCLHHPSTCKSVISSKSCGLRVTNVALALSAWAAIMRSRILRRENPQDCKINPY